MGDAEPQPDEHQAAAFAALQQRFRAGLARRQQELRAAPDRASVAALLHRLAGAAGGYGLQALDEAARAALACCGEGADADALARALQRLHELLDRESRP